MVQNYTLTATALKNGKTLYQVVDNAGKVVAKRTSIRTYVACTITGEFFFGRLDLVGKGEHGRALAYVAEEKNTSRERYDAILAREKRDIHRAHVAHLQCFKQFSTPERLNAPMKDWEKEHLLEFYGKEVADRAVTAWDFQVETCNDEFRYNEFLKRMGDYETWKAKTEEYVTRREPQLEVAYLQR